MPWLTEPLGLVVVAAITVAGSWLTTRATTRSANRTTTQTVAGQIESARMQAEQGAFERAKEFYEGVIERQDREHEEDQAEIRGLKERDLKREAEINVLRAELANCRSACRALARRVGGPDIPEIEES